MAAQAGSITDVTGGDLAMGDATSVNGYYSNGMLHVGSNSVTLGDADGAVFDSAAQVTLGDGSNPGTLTAASGMTLNSGGTITGHGTIDTPNSATAPLVNSGSLSGNSLDEPLTLLGYVTGAGKFDNVAFSGAFVPEQSGTAENLYGSIKYGGTLDIEIGGYTPGSEYDQLNHTLGSGVAELGGTLDVSLLNGFMPQAGDAFDILSATGGISGMFATTMLPIARR